MNIEYSNGRKKENLVVSNFYYEVAKKMAEEEQSDEPIDIVVKTPDGEVEYKITRRSGTQFICEVNNELPDDYNNTNIEDKFLTCVDPEKNAYKFYKLSVCGNEVKASYGRMGVSKGELFGERSFMYPLSMFWIKYYEKIGKGYVDRTELYLTNEPVEKQTKPDEKKPLKQNQNHGPSLELFTKLRNFAKHAVKKANVKVPITQAIINKSNELLDFMRNSDTVEDFNKHLMDLISILQRPVRTGDGRGVKDLMADSAKDFARIINRESDLVAAMEGVNTGKVVETGDFNDYGIEVYEATEKQKDEVLRHLSDSLKPKVKNVYRVIPKQQKERFDAYLKKNNIKSVRQLWHGSRNENWMSIIQNSLQLNPNAVITGKMFGHGIYFAPSSMKSWNYTSYRGTSWARGNSDTAFMGLYAVAYGKPYDVHAWSCGENYKNSVLKGNYDCHHAHAGVSLLNDEIVFFDEASVLLNYIVEFE